LGILILNGFIPLTSSGSELSYMFQTCVHQGLGTQGDKGSLTLDNPTGKFVSIRLGIWHSKHWLLVGKGIWCFMCSIEMVAEICISTG
jgi:hypothetical protein